MEAYRRETRESVKLFCQRELTFSECIAAFDVALLRLMPRLSGESVAALKRVMFANYDAVFEEMERRERWQKWSPEKPALHRARFDGRE